jgi:hypothetical protein
VNSRSRTCVWQIPAAPGKLRVLRRRPRSMGSRWKSVETDGACERHGRRARSSDDAQGRPLRSRRHQDQAAGAAAIDTRPGGACVLDCDAWQMMWNGSATDSAAAWAAAKLATRVANTTATAAASATTQRSLECPSGYECKIFNPPTIIILRGNLVQTIGATEQISRERLFKHRAERTSLVRRLRPAHGPTSR